MSEISLSGDLERVSRTGYNNSKNREKNILIIYAPRECPSGSEGQTCGEIWFRYGRRESGCCE